MIDQPTLLFLELGMVLALATIAGFAARKIGQPAVVGEIVLGILLGPTLFHGMLSRVVVPAEIRPYLGAFANLGIVLFMFLVGLEFDRVLLRGAGRITVGAVLGSTAVPFGLGCLLALYLLRHHQPANRVGFVLYIGVAFAVTALPVLARILADRELTRTRVGVIALSTATVCDIVAWSALALVQVIAGQGTGARLLPLVVPYVLVMFLGVRPALSRLLRDRAEGAALTVPNFAIVLTGLLLSAAVTQLLGLHFIFGAFLFGLVMPRSGGGRLRAELIRRTGGATTLLLPVYFVVAGLDVDLSRIGSAGVLELVLIIVVAVLGKFAGVFLGARSQGLSGRSAAVLGTLMNTRGLTELVVLGVGLRSGMLDHALYSLMVVMAVLTTAMCGPMLTWLTRGEPAAGSRTDEREEVRGAESRG